MVILAAFGVCLWCLLRVDDFIMQICTPRNGFRTRGFGGAHKTALQNAPREAPSTNSIQYEPPHARLQHYSTQPCDFAALASNLFRYSIIASLSPACTRVSRSASADPSPLSRAYIARRQTYHELP